MRGLFDHPLEHGCKAVFHNPRMIFYFSIEDATALAHRQLFPSKFDSDLKTTF